MEPFILEEQPEPEELDEATNAAIEVGLAELRRGETVSLEQSNLDLKKGIEAWRKAQEAVRAA